MKFRSLLLATAATLCITLPALAAEPHTSNRYREERFVASQAKYHPKTVQDKFINAWGIAIRPAGAGGHFWVTAQDTSYEYVGDVRGASDPRLRALHQDKLQYVKLPVGGDENFATGVVFVDSKDQFILTQQVEDAEPITAPAKFLFASDGGVISAWTERKKEDGNFDRPLEAIPVIDASKDGAQFFGLAMDAAYTRLYAADFGEHPGIRVYDGQFKPLPLAFAMPFDENKNGAFDPGEYAPFNVQALPTPTGEHHIFVAYALTQTCPPEEITKGSCKKGEFFVGEEDTAEPGHGRLAEFTEDGQLVTVWKDAGHLSAPWGMAFAPADFGALSGALLVGNFGDGSIAAFDPKTRAFLDVLRDTRGKPVKIEKIWGILFGNGESLGDKNALYFAAGPDDEKDGLFGSLRPASK